MLIPKEPTPSYSNRVLLAEAESLCLELNKYVTGEEAPWRVRPMEAAETYHWFALDGHAGRSLHLSVPWNKPERIVVACTFPIHDRYGSMLPSNVKAPEIGQHRARGMRTLARYVVTHLLPVYLPILKECQEKQAAYQASDDRVCALVGRLAGIPGCSTVAHHHDHVHVSGTTPAGQQVYGSLHVHGDGSVKVELRYAPGEVVAGWLLDLQLTPPVDRRRR